MRSVAGPGTRPRSGTDLGADRGGPHSGFRVGGWVPRSAGEICTLVAFVVAKRTSVQISLPGRHEPPTDQHTAVRPVRPGPISRRPIRDQLRGTSIRAVTPKWSEAHSGGGAARNGRSPVRAT